MMRACLILLLTLAFFLPTACIHAASTAPPDVLLLDNFEGPAKWDGLSQTANPRHAGRHGGRWTDLARNPSATFKNTPRDWTRYDRICFWLHSARANGQQLTLVLNSDNPGDAAGWDYYFHHFRVDWQGWRFFSLRLDRDLSVSRKPRGWDQIDGMSFAASGWDQKPLPDTELTFDDVALVRDPAAVAITRGETRLGPAGLESESILRVTNRTARSSAFELRGDVSGLRHLRLELPARTPRIAPGDTAEVRARLTQLPNNGTLPPLTQETARVLLQPADAGAADLFPPLTVEVTATMPLPKRPHPCLFATAADLAQAKARANQLPWAKEVYDNILQAAQNALAAPLAIPDKGGQWPHHYACPKHGRSLKTLSPTQHQCPVDGEIFTGWPYDDVVISKAHGGNANAVVNLGLAYQWTGDRRFAERSAAIFRGYAAQYPHYPLHDVRGKESRSGARMYAQTLDEAVDLIPFAWGYDLIAGSDVLSDADRQTIENDFLREAAHVIQRNDAGMSNWQSWHNGGVGAVGFALNDAELASWALYGRSGFFAQMKGSVLSDGWWYEGAPSYHFYALDALVRLAEAAHQAGVDCWHNPTFKGLFDAPLLYTYPDLRIPAVNDSDVFALPGQARLYELAYARLGDARYLPLFSRGRKSREALIWGVEPLPAAAAGTALASHQFTGTGAAVLRAGTGDNAVYLHLDYGPHGGGHGHPDKLSLILFALGKELAPDPGRLLYSVPAHGTWYRQTLSHNALLVDGKSQQPTEGSLLLFAPGGALQVATGESKEAYPGVVLRRTLALVDVPGRDAPPYVVDFATAQSSAAHAFDWAYHIRGTLKAGESTPAAPLGKDQGYQHLSNLRQARDAAAPVDWLQEAGGLRLWTVAAPAQRFFAEGMGQPATENITLVLDRRQGNEACFTAVLEPYHKTPAIRGVRRAPVTANGKTLPETAALGLVIERGDETDLVVLAPGIAGEKQADGERFTGNALLAVRRGGQIVQRLEK